MAQTGFRLGSDWAQTGLRLGSNDRVKMYEFAYLQTLWIWCRVNDEGNPEHAHTYNYNYLRVAIINLY